MYYLITLVTSFFVTLTLVFFLNKYRKTISFLRKEIVFFRKKIKEKKEAFVPAQINFKELGERLEKKEKNNEQILHELMKKNEELTRKLLSGESLENRLKRLEGVKEEILKYLSDYIPIDVEKAEGFLFSLVEKEMEIELNKYKEKKIRWVEENIKEISTKLLCCSLEKYSSELVFNKNVETLTIKKKEIVGKIIGKNGCNINSFKKITGTDLVVTEGGKEMWSLQVSSFNSFRRELAYQTLLSLVEKEKFSPNQIEKNYNEVIEKTDLLIRNTGKLALQELEITGVAPELISILGKLKYRTSYGQNVLQHSLEVAKIAGNIAAELELDIVLARRAAIFHDIGKAVEGEEDNSHVKSGVKLAKMYGEPSEVINAIASHHHDDKADNLYSFLVIAADKLSAGRIGARNHQLETYLQRLNNLEKITSGIFGIKKCYVFQAGREIMILVDSEVLNDREAWDLSQKIKKMIRREVVIPGEITISVIREKKFTQKI